jgi:transposase
MSSPTPPAITSPSVPELGEVRAWLEKMIKALRFIELVTAVLTLITRMRDLNTELVRQLTHLRQARPKSETLARLERQLVLPFVIETKPATKPDGATDGDEGKKRKSRAKPPGRPPLPAHLERVVVLNPVPPALRICPRCGRLMTRVGHSVCSTLNVVPARVVVEERWDETVACPDDDTIVSAPTPPQIVERGKLGTTLIIESVADKFLEHQPIERQCRRWTRMGVDIAPQTLGRSVGAGIDLLAPISRSIREQTHASALLATDATGVPVLDRDAAEGIRTGTIWCWIGDQRWVTFDYTPRGTAESVRLFLGEDLHRTVQCDGTPTLSFLERAGGKRPGCWAHARRRFVAAARGGDTLALPGLKLMRTLFAIERLSAIHLESPEQRKARRLEQSKPVLAAILVWIDELRGFIPPKTPLGQALGYVHRQWARLCLFLEDGRLEITNNRVERELRSLVLGRKNWLFVWEDIGGARAASILTILGTCIAHRINPRAYLHAVAKMILEGWPQARLRELLPDRIARLRPELRLLARASPTAPQLPSPSSR